MIEKDTNEKLGISIRGGAKGSKGNPLDSDDEGIFISKVGEPHLQIEVLMNMHAPVEAVMTS